MTNDAPPMNAGQPPVDPPSSGLGDISVSGATKMYETAQHVAIEGVNLHISSGEFVSIVGRSGCGKTTLLRMIAGFHQPTRGDVLLDGKPIVQPGPDRGMVFQGSALFPWLTAEKNILFGLRAAKMPREEAKQRVGELLELVGIPQAANRFPHELSGGMAQRVAIARALAPDPDILLMDEPFGALDELTRDSMQDELLRIWSAARKTVVFVTHSIDEAIYLSDRVIVMTPHPGRVRADIAIDLERPRDRTSSAFSEYEREIYDAIN